MYTLASINVGIYMLGEMELPTHKPTFTDRSMICREMLELYKQHDVDIICTQEDVLLGQQNDPSSYTPEFESMYASYGYVHMTHGLFDRNQSQTLQQANPTYNSIYVGNVIYVKESLISKVEPVLSFPTSSLPACLAQISFVGSSIRIANVHLCGGRFDDEQVFSLDDPDYYKTKFQSVQHMEQTIVCGDFNASRSIGYPGGFPDYAYACSLLYKQPMDTQLYYAQHPNDIERIWDTWQCGPVQRFYERDHYRGAFNDDQLRVIGETSCRGKCIVDWIFYDPNQVLKLDSHCEPMYCNAGGSTFCSRDIRLYSSSMELSDHHMMMFTFRVIQNGAIGTTTDSILSSGRYMLYG